MEHVRRDHPTELQYTPGPLGSFQARTAWRSGFCILIFAFMIRERQWSFNELLAAAFAGVQQVLDACVHEENRTGMRVGLGGRTTMRTRELGGAYLTVLFKGHVPMRAERLFPMGMSQ